MVVVVVDGKEYNLNEQQVTAMKYIEEAEAIEKGSNVLIFLFRSPLKTSTRKHLSLSLRFYKK